MKYLLSFSLVCALAFGCQPKVLSGPALQSKLIETMQDYLPKTLAKNVTFKINEVAFYPDAEKKLYNCNFTVTMFMNGKDTTGLVVATISNDFMTVHRLQ
jgi:hypothetical protein